MSSPAQDLFQLLPAILRLRDAAQAQVSPGWLAPQARDDYAVLQTLVDAGTPLTPLQAEQYEALRREAAAGPLASLLGVLVEQLAVLQEDIDQLYDDQFIETCADWVAPYIGDLIGYRPLHGVVPGVASPRAEVAHTIGYRRRKGTVIVLEQLARDVTGWHAAAVEYFQRLVMTQSMLHPRAQCLATPDLRRWEPLERRATAFDSIMHTADMRRIGNGRGRHNLRNVGLFIWRLDAHALTGSPAVPVDARRWRFHPLGIDQPLVTRPRTLPAFDRLATPLDVPIPISRRALADRLADHYLPGDGSPGSLRLYDDSGGDFQPIPASRIRVCNLDDDAGGWAHLPTDDHYVIDPQLGRIASPPGLAPGTRLRVDFHGAFSADMGGGEYDRAASVDDPAPPPHLVRVPQEQPTIQAALALLGADGGVVEITDSGRYEESLAIDVPAGKRVELRAADGCRPALMLGAPMSLAGGDDAEIRLSGLLIANAPLQVAAQPGNRLARLSLVHCTLVPGLALQSDSTPTSPDAASLLVEIADTAVVLERTISGALRIDPDATLQATDSIIDATAATAVACAAPDGYSAGAAIQWTGCTVIGKIHARSFTLISNCLLLARLAAADPWPAPVIAQRRQQGCVRYSCLPESARAPRRYRCLPESAASPALAAPRFTTLRYGFAGYAQLDAASGAQLLQGADNETQPGAFNFVFHAQREANLRLRLDEYLRVGLEAGILHGS